MRNVFHILILTIIGSNFTFAQPSATIKIPHLKNLPSGVVYSPIIVEELSGEENFGTFQLLITYDSKVITPSNVNFTNPDLPFTGWSNNLGYGPNMIILTWLSHSGGVFFSAGDELCEIEWQYKDTTTYSFINFATVTENGNGTRTKHRSSVSTSAGTMYNVEFINGSIGTQ